MTDCITNIGNGVEHWEVLAKDYLPLKSIETQVYSNLFLSLGKICLFILVVFVIFEIRKKMPYKVKRVFNCIFPIFIFLLVLLYSLISIHERLSTSIIGNHNTLITGMLNSVSPLIFFAFVISVAFIFLRNK